jgi:aryl carrier-like protein
MRQGDLDMTVNVNDGTNSLRQDYLLRLWCTQLNIPRLEVHDDFFEAGGSSMQVIEMLMTVSDKYGKEIDFAEFFKNPCIHQLDQLLKT